MNAKEVRILDWVLRLAVFGEFLGHGVLGLQGKASWVGWVQQLLSVDVATATTMVFVVGALDVVVAIAVLVWPRVPRAVLLWAALWGLWTAILRPLVGESFWDFVERGANWGAPLALLLVRGWPKTFKEWWRS